MEKQNKKLEDTLDAKTSQLIRLRKAVVQQTEMDANITTPLHDALQEWGNPAPEQ